LLSSVTTTEQEPRHEPGRRISSCRAQTGFSFLEVLLAALLLGTVLVASMNSFSGSIATQHALAGESVTAFGLAREIHTLAEALPRGPASEEVTGIADVAVLADLDGASFSPPVDAARRSLGSAAGWSQTVTVDTVDLLAPGVAAADDGSPAQLFRLIVKVDDGAGGGGTYTWWLPR